MLEPLLIEMSLKALGEVIRAIVSRETDLAGITPARYDLEGN